MVLVHITRPHMTPFNTVIYFLNKLRRVLGSDSILTKDLFSTTKLSD